MPGFDGFSVVKGVMEIEPPLFVFVTAYQEHAVRAFEANAVNYLMKPVEETKLDDTLARVRQRLTEKRSDRKSVGEGKRVSERVDLGGRRIIKKKKTANNENK